MNAPIELLHRPADPVLHQPKVLDPRTFRHITERFQDISIRPYSPVVGGIVDGFRFRDGEVSDDVKRYLYGNLLKYGFLSFVPGSIDAEDFEKFVHIFGSPRFAGNPQAP